MAAEKEFLHLIKAILFDNTNLISPLQRKDMGSGSLSRHIFPRASLLSLMLFVNSAKGDFFFFFKWNTQQELAQTPAINAFLPILWMIQSFTKCYTITEKKHSSTIIQWIGCPIQFLFYPLWTTMEWRELRDRAPVKPRTSLTLDITPVLWTPGSIWQDQIN